MREHVERPAGEFRIGAMLHALRKLGVTELLEDGIGETTELARATGCRPSSLARLLRALAACEVVVVTEDSPGRFRLTSDGARRAHAARPSLESTTGASGSTHMAAAWLELAHAVRTGRSAFQYAHGIEYRTYLARRFAQPDPGRGSLDAIAARAARALAAAHDLSPEATIVDVGGAPGVLLAAFLEKNRETRGVVFDQPSLCFATKALLGRRGLAGRAQVVAGDLLSEPPPHGDLYLLANVIGERSDEDSKRILHNCRRSATGASRLLVVEEIGVSGEPLAELERMILYGDGRERTLDEARLLIEAAGFAVLGVRSSGFATSILEGSPA